MQLLAPSARRDAPAGPPPDLEGLDPAWSRQVRTQDSVGMQRTWHVLDNAPALRGAAPAGTLLCVHGNPTWSYMWRDLLGRAAAAEPPWRAVAVDHLDMGFSQRTGTVRRLAQRIADLDAVTAALDLPAPVVTVGHDWGGVISLGWALANRDRLGGIVLGNTAVQQPPGATIPLPMQFARVPGLRWVVTATTPVFLEIALAIAHPRLASGVRGAYLAPYRGAARRAAIGTFVNDIPLVPSHPSWSALADVTGQLGLLADVPALILWGPRDPVFREVYLRDLRARLPQASVHRFEGAGHLVAEDADIAGAILAWLSAGNPGPSAARSALAAAAAPQPREAASSAASGPAGNAEAARRPLWAELEARAADPGPAIVEPGTRGRGTRTVSWALLNRRVNEVAAGLTACGVHAGDRVALLVPPGADLAVVVYACLRIGAVIVVADAGLGLPGLNRAVRGAGPQHIVAIERGLLAARALGWPGQRIAVGRVDRVRARLLGARLTLAEVARRGAGHPLPAAPDPGQVAAVAFTSGSTGPAKGVVYTYAQLAAGRDVLAATYPVQADGRLVAAFAPFALFGPALGVTSVVPDMDVTAPATLTAAALADAVAAAGASAVFASPAALANVVRTQAALNRGQRDALRQVQLLLSAGAPVPVWLLEQVTELMPAATAHTPYGMTEVLPVTDVTLAELQAAGPGDGVLVGRPVAGVEVAISPLDGAGAAGGDLTGKPGVTGEIVVRAAHAKERYDQLWVTEHLAARPTGWHRTGDAGHFDSDGRLWVEGRMTHLLSTAEGVLTPVGVEQRMQAVAGVALAALVGVGPAGTQQAVAVLESVPAARRGGLAPAGLAAAARAAAGVDLAAVLVVPRLPTDVRHNAKIDRTRVAAWATRVLAGERGGAP
jgi:olefin beta-lactone synthetase